MIPTISISFITSKTNWEVEAVLFYNPTEQKTWKLIPSSTKLDLLIYNTLQNLDGKIKITDTKYLKISYNVDRDESRKIWNYLTSINYEEKSNT